MASREQSVLSASAEETLARYRVDLLCGGFPCQPVSYAGKRLAQADPRWLWPEFLRIISLLRPRYVIIENVPGLFTAGFGDVLSGLASCGYDAEWDCIPASSVGAPHKRERVWIVAYPMQPRLEGSIGRATDRLLAFAECTASQAQERNVWSYNVPLPPILRSHYGVPNYVDRIKSLGNAIVPQIAEALGRMILKALAQEAKE